MLEALEPRVLLSASVSGLDQIGPALAYSRQPNAPITELELSNDGLVAAFISSATNLGPASFGSNLYKYDLVTNSVLFDTEAIDFDLNADGDILAYSYQTTIFNEQTLVFENRVTIDILGGSNAISDLLTELNTNQSAGFTSVLNPSISNDGSKIVFEARTQEPTEQNPSPLHDVYLYDLVQQQLVLISDPFTGPEADGSSFSPVISADGQWVAFRSEAQNLLDVGYGVASAHIFLYDVDSGFVTQRLSPTQYFAINNTLYDVLNVSEPSISDNGGIIAFGLTLDQGPAPVVYFNQSFQHLYTASITQDETEGSGTHVVASGDGLFVGFISSDSNLIFEDMNFAPDAFAFRISSGEVSRISGRENNIESFATTTQIAFSDGFGYFVSDETDIVIDAPFTQALFGVTELTDFVTSGYLLPPITQPDDNTFYRTHLSGTGQFVSFASAASNLVEFDRNGLEDLFVVNRQSGVIERANLASSEEFNPTLAFGGAISDDGRFVVFRDYANLLNGFSSPFRTDIFLIDRDSPGYVERISVDEEGVQANGNSLNSDISANGLIVAFDSVASSLIGDDSNAVNDVFIKDRLTGVVERVSVSSSEAQANAASKLISISADGQFVLFSSLADNLVIDDNNGVEDLFLRDLANGVTYLVSVTDGGSQIGAATTVGAMSDDGRYITFQSIASEIVPGDSNNRFDVFVLDRFTNVVERVSVDENGQQASSDSYSPTLSPDGRFVAFISNAALTGLGPGLFIRDRSDDTLTYVGTAAGTQPTFSADLSTIAFTSHDALVQGDTNGKTDAYVANFNAGPAGNAGIQGQVFVDLNSNQEPDSIETVNQVQVYLDLDNSGLPDEGEPVVNTDANGAFNFAGLDPGLYILRAIPPAGYQSNVEPINVVLDFGDEVVVNIPIQPVFRDATLSVDPASIVEGGTTATLTVTIDQTSLVPITITLGFSGPALLDEDFTVSQQQLVIGPGQLSATADLSALTDGFTETGESFDVFISELTYANDTADGEPVTVSILDGSPQVLVTLSADPLSIQEGQSSVITATLSQISDSEVVVLLSVGGNVIGGDYQLSGNTITIPAGELNGAVTITAAIDTEQETLEMVGLAISEVDGADEDGVQEVFIDIVDGVVSLPDLLVDIQLDAFLTLQPQQKTTLPVRVANDGDLASSGGRVLLVLSDDETFDDGDAVLGSANLPGIQPENFADINVNITVPAAIPDGEYFVIAIADPDNDVAESDEDNNTESYAATVEFIFGEGGAGKGGGFNFTDDDGTNTTFKLTGGGTGELIFDDGFIDLLLNNTTPNSSLKITTKNSGQQGDDGLITIRNIIVNGSNVGAAEARTLLAGKGGKSVAPADEATDATLGKLIAKTTRLIGSLDAGSGLKSVDLAQADGAVMNIGPSADPTETLTLKLVQASNLTINSQMPIKSLTTTRWIDDDDTPDVLTAPSLGAMKITGNKSLGLAGDFQADLVLTSAGDATLAATVSGTLSGATWTVTGGAKSLKLANVDAAALSFTGSVGTVSAAAWTAGSLSASTVKSIRTTGAFGADLTVTGNVASALGGARFGGTLSGNWSLAGGAGAITAPSISNLNLRSSASITSISTGTLTDSRVFLGVDAMLDTLPTQAGDFTNPAAVLGSLTVSGTGQSFVRSLVAAPTINTVSLREVDTSGDTELGLAALLMNSVTRTVNGASVRLTGLDTAGESVQDGAFVLRIVDDEPPVEG
jgi:hypothetical protein